MLICGYDSLLISSSQNSFDVNAAKTRFIKASILYPLLPTSYPNNEYSHRLLECYFYEAVQFFFTDLLVYQAKTTLCDIILSNVFVLK